MTSSSPNRKAVSPAPLHLFCPPLFLYQPSGCFLCPGALYELLDQSVRREGEKFACQRCNLAVTAGVRNLTPLCNCISHLAVSGLLLCRQCLGRGLVQLSIQRWTVFQVPIKEGGIPCSEGGGQIRGWVTSLHMSKCIFEIFSSLYLGGYEIKKSGSNFQPMTLGHSVINIATFVDLQKFWIVDSLWFYPKNLISFRTEYKFKFIRVSEEGWWLMPHINKYRERMNNFTHDLKWGCDQRLIWVLE